jgi:hypothetical protein
LFNRLGFHDNVDHVFVIPDPVTAAEKAVVTE